MKGRNTLNQLICLLGATSAGKEDSGNVKIFCSSISGSTVQLCIFQWAFEMIQVLYSRRASLTVSEIEAPLVKLFYTDLGVIPSSDFISTEFLLPNAFLLKILKLISISCI